MTDTFGAVLADVREEAERRDYQDGVLTTDEVRYHLDRLAAAHAAEVATIRAHIEGLEANLRNLSPLNYEERCRLRDAEARVRELEAGVRALIDSAREGGV